MSIHHDKFGELLTAKETCEATGFTMNQLRNWRVPARRALAPIGYVAIGTTPYYRKIVVQAWLDENGAQQGAYYPSELDKKFPISVGESLSIQKNQDLATLNAITTDNVVDWLNQLVDVRGIGVNTPWREINKEIQDALGLPNVAVSPMLRHTNPDFWIVATHSARLFTIRDKGIEMSLEEMLALPIGDNPPARETKFKA